MSTETASAEFEPGLSFRELRREGAPGASTDIWEPLLRSTPSPAEDASDVADEPPASIGSPLLFDEDELARLCAAAAAKARTQTLAGEVARLRAEAVRLAGSVHAELRALQERERGAWSEARRRLGELLAAAFSQLAPDVILRTRRRQLARELAACLEPLTSGGRLRVYAPPALAEELAAGLAVAPEDGPLGLEVVPDGGFEAGGFRVEAGDALVECEPARLIEAVAQALRAVLDAGPHEVGSTAGETGEAAGCTDPSVEERDGQ